MHIDDFQRQSGYSTLQLPDNYSNVVHSLWRMN